MLLLSAAVFHSIIAAPTFEKGLQQQRHRIAS